MGVTDRLHRIAGILAGPSWVGIARSIKRNAAGEGRHA